MITFKRRFLQLLERQRAEGGDSTTSRQPETSLYECKRYKKKVNVLQDGSVVCHVSTSRKDIERRIETFVPPSRNTYLLRMTSLRLRFRKESNGKEKDGKYTSSIERDVSLLEARENPLQPIHQGLKSNVLKKVHCSRQTLKGSAFGEQHPTNHVIQKRVNKEVVTRRSETQRNIFGSHRMCGGMLQEHRMAATERVTRNKRKTYNDAHETHFFRPNV